MYYIMIDGKDIWRQHTWWAKASTILTASTHSRTQPITKWKHAHVSPFNVPQCCARTLSSRQTCPLRTQQSSMGTTLALRERYLFFPYRIPTSCPFSYLSVPIRMRWTVTSSYLSPTPKAFSYLNSYTMGCDSPYLSPSPCASLHIGIVAEV